MTGIEVEGRSMGLGVRSEPCKPTTSFCGTPTHFVRGDTERPARTAVVPVRLTPGERDGIQANAQATGISLSEFLRRAALKRRLPPLAVPEVNRRTYEELARIGNNLNQLVRAVHGRAIRCVDGDLLGQLGDVVRQLALAVLGADGSNSVPVLAGLPRGRAYKVDPGDTGRLVAPDARPTPNLNNESPKRAPGALPGGKGFQTLSS